MAKRKWLAGAIGVGAVVAFAARQRLLAGWAANVDPLDGQAVEFPPGLHRMVKLPDGAELSTVTVGDGPSIVCVHGLTGSRHDWGPMAPGLLAAGPWTNRAGHQRGRADGPLDGRDGRDGVRRRSARNPTKAGLLARPHRNRGFIGVAGFETRVPIERISISLQADAVRKTTSGWRRVDRLW